MIKKEDKLHSNALIWSCIDFYHLIIIILHIFISVINLRIFTIMRKSSGTIKSHNILTTSLFLFVVSLHIIFFHLYFILFQCPSPPRLFKISYYDTNKI